MLIDDYISYGVDLSNQLKGFGYEVYYSPTAEGICDFIDKFNPQILFLDIELNESRNGIEVCKEVATTYKELPIIIISSHSRIDVKEKAVEAGALSYVEKPLSSKLLTAYVERYIPDSPFDSLEYEIEVDFKEQLISFSDGSMATLTPIQCQMFRILYDHLGEYVTVYDFVETVWNSRSKPENAHAIIYNNIASIRQLLKPAMNTFLRTKRGMGYYLMLGKNESMQG